MGDIFAIIGWRGRNISSIIGVGKKRGGDKNPNEDKSRLMSFYWN